MGCTQVSERSAALCQALVQALHQNVAWQVNANEYHLADAGFVGFPQRPQVAAHQLMHALEDDLALGANHVQHTLVAQHARAVHIDDGTQKVVQLGGAEWPGGTVDKAFHVIVVMVVVAVCLALLMLVRGMVAVLTVFMVVVIVVVFGQEIRVDVQLGIQVEAFEIQHLGQRYFAEVRGLNGRTRVHVLEAVGQCIEFFGADQL